MAEPHPVLAGTETHRLQSNAVGREFVIFVGHCGPAGAVPEAVLYLTDANGMFGLTVDTVRLMQLMDLVPPMLVVGVGYPLGAIDETIDIRMLDLTPTVDELYSGVVPGAPPSGGGPAFGMFVRHELQPWVGDAFGPVPERAVYFGHSLGGLFGAWMLCTQPDAFTDYILGSPSLWWDRGVAFEVEQAYADGHDDLAARVFVGIGGDETQDGRLREAARLPAETQEMLAAWPIDMVNDVERFVTTLRGRCYPSLELASGLFADEFHVTVAGVNLSRGLRWVFDSSR